MLNVARHFHVCAEISSCPGHTGAFIPVLRRWACWQRYLKLVLLELPCYKWFLHVPGSWSQGRLRLECLITFSSYVTSTTNREAWLVLVSIGELHRKETRTDTWSLHAVWASPHDFFQRAMNEIRTHLRKHLCEYPHWRTWEQKVLRAVSKTSTWLTFGYGSREVWNPNSTLCCPSPGTACTSLPHQHHQGPKLVLVQKSVPLKMF